MSPGPSVWMTTIAHPGWAASAAAWAEKAGLDGMLVVDSQNLSGDPYVALALAAKETDRLGLGTGVTNPFTRHPAATACSIATVQAESGGRAVLGIGRGDSALAHVGLAPAPVPVFERYLRRLQGYLRGEEAPFEDEGDGIAPVDRLGLADAPHASRIHWLPRDQPKVPVEVAATGPRVIGLAARLADRVLFALGADPERLRWGIDTARAERPDVGLGAFVNVVAHPDLDVARKLASGSTSTFARFNVMHGKVSGPGIGDTALLEKLHDAYDMNAHTRGSSPQARTLTAEFMDHFAVVGPPDACVRRLREIVGLGIERLVAVGPLGDLPGEAAVASRCFVEEVLPALRR